MSTPGLPSSRDSGDGTPQVTQNDGADNDRGEAFDDGADVAATAEDDWILPDPARFGGDGIGTMLARTGTPQPQ